MCPIVIDIHCSQGALPKRIGFIVLFINNIHVVYVGFLINVTISNKTGRSVFGSAEIGLFDIYILISWLPFRRDTRNSVSSSSLLSRYHHFCLVIITSVSSSSLLSRHHHFRLVIITSVSSSSLLSRHHHFCLVIITYSNTTFPLYFLVGLKGSSRHSKFIGNFICKTKRQNSNIM